MQTKRDYYEVLDIPRKATSEDIKRAYRKLALKFHPDRFDGDKKEGETRFKELAEAYEVLSDDRKRQRYDQFGHEGLRGTGMHDYSNMGFGDIFSMFQDIFGGMGFSSAGTVAERGLDLETEVELSLEDVATGMDQTLEFTRMDFCPMCTGSGAKPGTDLQRCPTCSGYGQVQRKTQGFFGVAVQVTTCPDCHGRGQVAAEHCDACGGSGRAETQQDITVHIPPGIRDGQVVRVRGQGEPGRVGTSRGDLHVYVRIKPHPLLTRRGNDLVCQMPVSFPVAALGGRISIPTLEGPEKVDVAAGSQNGDILTLRRRGLPPIGGGSRGDLHAQIFVEVPRKLSREQRELLKEFARLDGDNVGERRKGFIEQMKDYFRGRDKDGEADAAADHAEHIDDT
jgi:molecular chaperone DnaJ